MNILDILHALFTLFDWTHLPAPLGTKNRRYFKGRVTSKKWIKQKK
jgi:hypothetical protein